MKKMHRIYIPAAAMLALTLVRCSSSGNNSNAVQQLQSQVSALQDSIQGMKAMMYKPGLGELMINIQLNHAKLWFAGVNANWPLASFELGEIKETVNTAQEIETDRPEVKSIPMIFPPLDSINQAIIHKNGNEFKSAFRLLTNTCNTCHRDNNFAFNVITIPAVPPVPNQDFKPGK